jgi:hypothetical protein
VHVLHHDKQRLVARRRPKQPCGRLEKPKALVLGGETFKGCGARRELRDEAPELSKELVIACEIRDGGLFADPLREQVTQERIRERLIELVSAPVHYADAAHPRCGDYGVGQARLADAGVADDRDDGALSGGRGK